MTLDTTLRAEIYRSGLTRRYRWRLVVKANGERIAKPGKALGYSRRIDALSALQTATGARLVESTIPAGKHYLWGYTTTGTLRHIELREVTR